MKRWLPRGTTRRDNSARAMDIDQLTRAAMKQSRSIHDHFIVLSPDKQASIESCDSGLYQRLDDNYAGFAGHELVSCHTFSEDWPSWEVHPKGDEIVMLLSGRVTFILELDDEEKAVELTKQGAYVIVPRGVWHTATVSEPSTVLFITPGEGTQHRDA